MARLLSLFVLLLGLGGCLDLSTDGKVFACPECTVGPGGGAGGAGGTGGAGGAGGGAAACQCQARPTECRGDTLVSYARPQCQESGVCKFQEVETPCPGACTGGQCEGSTCFGVTCDVPPPPRCLDAQTLRGFTAAGTCSGGTCSYGAVDVSCTCLGDRCLANPCAGVNCNTPPAPTCAGASLRTWSSPGVCDGTNGQCFYTPTDTPCAGGCSNGQCNGDKCAGVTCANPPAPFCTSASTVRQFAAAGTCNPASGSCSYTSTDSACPSGVCSGGACQPVVTGCSASCASGCCAGDSCVPYAQQSAGTCGSGGAACVACAGGQSCGASGTCVGCTPESDAALCSRAGRVCGPFTGTDNCGASRTVGCGTCPGTQTCGASGQCQACVGETDAAFCARVGKTCGTVSGTDNCGAARTVSSCGTCTSPQSCTSSNVCACVPETNGAFCTRVGKNCGAVTGTDNCGAPRSVSSCGTCSGNAWCGGGGTANVCGVTRMTFSSSWQTLPNTGSATIEYRCAGTVSLSGARCSSSQDPVQVRINGSTYVLYPGCDSNRNNCVSTVPSGASYVDDGYAAGGRLLCDAMGWSLNNSLADKNAGTTDRAVAVVQTNPTVYGTDSAQKNYGTYIECRQ